MKRSTWWYSSVILFVGVLLYLLNLGTNTVDIMEARNFVTAREVLQSGDWLYPTMNGELRLAKPPLPTWITALFASIFGVKSLFFLRLPAALMSIWLLFSMNALVKRITQNNLLGCLSAISLAGMLYVLLLGRRGTWDIYTHSFMLASIVQFIAMFQSAKPFRHGIFGGFLLGFAFLSKGPVSLFALSLPFIMAYLVYQRPLFRKEHYVSLFAYVVLGVFISSSWFAFIHFTIGDKAQQVIGNEVKNWSSYNVRPFWYYIKDYPMHSGIWAAILAMGVFTKYTWNKSVNKGQYQFFWLWTLLSVFLLSLVPEKKVRYLFPTFIPASFLVASYFYYLLVDFDHTTKKLDVFVFRIHWALFAIVCFALPVAVYILFYQKGIMNLEYFVAIIICSMLCGFLLLQSLKKQYRHYFLLGIFGLLTTSTAFIFPNINKVKNNNYHSIEEVQELHEFDNLPCYALEETRIEIVWHVGRKIKEVQNLENLQPPYLLLTNSPPQNYLSNQSFEVIGHYDNNSKPQGHRHHNQSLSKYVAVVR